MIGIELDHRSALREHLESVLFDLRRMPFRCARYTDRVDHTRRRDRLRRGLRASPLTGLCWSADTILLWSRSSHFVRSYEHSAHVASGLTLLLQGLGIGHTRQAGGRN